MHDDATEIGLAEIALHVVIDQVERAVIKPGVAKGPITLQGNNKFRTFNVITK